MFKQLIDFSPGSPARKNIQKDFFSEKWQPTFDDLKIEIEKLKREIISLKQNQMITDHRLLKLEEKESFSNPLTSSQCLVVLTVQRSPFMLPRCGL